MQDEKFVIRAYGKSELALLYAPHYSKKTALKRLNRWLEVNPRLRHLVKRSKHYYTPKQVRLIVGEVGEPFEIE
jgi:hypothetical protein